jgi:hypothetical protein
VPVVATNPVTGAAWQVFHVDNTAAPGGNGSAETPFNSIEAAVTRPVNDPYDIVYLRRGSSSAPTPYVTPVGGFRFGNDNQYLIGEGSTISIPTVSCGERLFFVGSGTATYPVISNPIGTAIVIEEPGATVSHVSIVNSSIGISDGAGIAAPATALIQDVTIAGSDTASQRGIVIASSTGTFGFDNVRLSNLSNDGLVLSAANGRVTLTSSTFDGIAGTAIRVSGSAARATVANTSIANTNGIAVAAAGAGSFISLTSGTIARTTEDAVVASGAGAEVELANMRITDTSGSALTASGSDTSIDIRNSSIINTQSDAVILSGAQSRMIIDATTIVDTSGNGVLVTGSNTRLEVRNGSAVNRTSANGIEVRGSSGGGAGARNANVQVVDSAISRTGANGIIVTDGDPASDRTGVRILRSTITDTQGTGITVAGMNGIAEVAQIFSSTIRNTADVGVRIRNSNVDIGPNPEVRGSAGTTIANAGGTGIEIGNSSLLPSPSSRVSVVNSTITGSPVGIDAAAGSFNNDIDLSLRNNRITTTAAGTGISLSAVFDATLPPAANPVSRITADIRGNTISVSGGQGILLNTVGGPTEYPLDPPISAPFDQRPLTIAASGAINLSNLNAGATVGEEPAGTDVTPTSINWNPAASPRPPLPPFPTAAP